MSSSLCEEAVRLIRHGAAATGVTLDRAAEIEAYVRELAGELASGQTPEQAARARKMFCAEGIPEPGQGKKRRLSRAERRRIAQEEARLAKVDAVFGPRKPLQSERAEFADYEPADPDLSQRR